LHAGEFREYVSAFNARDYAALARFYSSDVTLSFPSGITLTGPDAIAGFYRSMHEAVREVMEIDFLLIGQDSVAAEFYVEFHAFADYPQFPRGPLRAGDVVRHTSFVHYDLDSADRFRRIRVAVHRQHDEGERSRTT
jgi:SnoaL-like domain